MCPHSAGLVAGWFDQLAQLLVWTYAPEFGATSFLLSCRFRALIVRFFTFMSSRRLVCAECIIFVDKSFCVMQFYSICHWSG